MSRRSKLPLQENDVAVTLTTKNDVTKEDRKDRKTGYYLRCKMWFGLEQVYPRGSRKRMLPCVLILSLALFAILYSTILPRVREILIRRNLDWSFPTAENGQALAIFYHIYTPSNKGKKGIQQSLDIVHEQINQISGSGVQQSVNRHVSLYYTTTGVEHVAKRATEQACNEKGLVCYWMGHWAEGQEEMTLSRLYKYCQHNPNSTVSYIHTKGSYHTNKGRNHAWRFHLTKAALTCAREMKASNHDCTVCGLQFYPVWTTFYPGNMWTGSCDYINQLWSPTEYRVRLETLVTVARDSGQFSWTLYNASNPGNLGLGRYAMEHWIASHPLVRPCEIVTATPHLEVWYEKNTLQLSVLANAPQHDWQHDGWFRWNRTNVELILQSSISRKEYFLLPGFLFKWRGLYNQVPPRDSWVWNWYPEGTEYVEQSLQDKR